MKKEKRKKVINLDEFEIIKKSQSIKGGKKDWGTPATQPTFPPTELPSACDNAS